ncbi:TetR/AcrR family transcriptional regulator [Phytohabitans suffuscus]|uniref:TetR family transcriptional regulator n=1 Tax=Phytohabitans suffuscus TaxID=624315 RepID=A0A6F8YUW1_9ACTN|nr:TetR/AcrR family transcriptional regulator [Phytohabitans suffuscus]BCB89773.1 TetR family transcriptional regulator [Phytohabitans suffuscus]
MTGQRADARRNHARLLAVAEAEIAAHGADASLEQIARVAGVGSATVRRHFPTRHALLEAVFQERIETLCARAGELAGAGDSRGALLAWLGEVTASAAAIRGLAVALTYDAVDDPAVAHDHCATARLTRAGDPLARRAAMDGGLAPGLTITDLLTLVTGIALATEHHPDPAAEAKRLLGVVVAGVSPRAGDAGAEGRTGQPTAASHRSSTVSS